MPNGHGHKDYGKHKYPEGGGNCLHGCGCDMHNFSSGGPVGLDPFGICPKNPIDGKFLGGDSDYQHVVEERISKLENRALTAETELRKVKPSEKKLADDLASARDELEGTKRCLAQIHNSCHAFSLPVPVPIPIPK